MVVSIMIQRYKKNRQSGTKNLGKMDKVFFPYFDNIPPVTVDI